MCIATNDIDNYHFRWLSITFLSGKMENQNDHMLVNLLVNETPKPSIIVLHMLARSAVGDARLINNVGDLGGVCPLPIEQLECLRGTEMVSIVRSFCVYCTLQYFFKYSYSFVVE